MNAERPEERVDETPEEQQAESQDDAAAETGKDEQETPVKAAPDDLAAAQAKADENWDRYLRVSAELENVRKRAARDVENAHKFALERFAE